MPSYYLAPICNDQQLDANGNPLVGGKIYTYLAGTSTASPTYTDNTGATPQANPIILNSLGLSTSPIWLVGGFPMKFVVTNSADVIQRTIDNVSGINDSSSTASEWTNSGFTPTYISATSFSVVGDQRTIFQVNRRVRTTNTGGLIYGRITVSTFATGITTVTVINDTGSMDAGLSVVAYGFLSFSPSSIPFALYAAAGANTDITSLSYLTVYPYVPVRQTVLSGPVDTNGFSAFGGSTGTTTVTAAGTLISAAANGFGVGTIDRIGSITNPSWSSLGTNGTMYLYLDIAANGTCTTGSTTLAQNYQWGGTRSTTNGQATFNIQEMSMTVGNGSVATQTHRVFVGEVTVAGGVVTAIVWYQLQGRYDSGWTATLPAGGTNTSRNHNLGVNPEFLDYVIECTTIDGAYAFGDRLKASSGSVATAWTGSSTLPFGFSATRLVQSISMHSFAAASHFTVNKTGFGSAQLTNASWRYKFLANRGW